VKRTRPLGRYVIRRPGCGDPPRHPGRFTAQAHAAACTTSAGAWIGAGRTSGPYDLLIGAALDNERWLFARQDTVEDGWKIVAPVLGDATPIHPYARGSWGPKEADRLLPGRDAWHGPAG